MNSSDRRDFDLLPDRRIIGLVPIDCAESPASAVSEMRVVLNWTEELKARAPIK